MLRLAKYVKPFVPLLVIAIVLLFVQAVSDLSLPNYLSHIVDVGIQQGGIENAVPVAVRQNEMEHLTLFMSDTDKAEVLSQYTLVEKTSPDYDKYVKDYPVLATESIYVLNTIDQAETDKLNGIMAKPWVVVSGIEQAIADPAKAAAMVMPEMAVIAAVVALIVARTGFGRVDGKVRADADIQFAQSDLL